MAKKRSNKNPSKKRAAPRKSRSTAKKKRSSWLGRLVLLLVLVALVLSGVYYFGSFKSRAQMERITQATLNGLRTHGAMPAPLAQLLDIPYDWIPSSSGMVVEGGELGRDPNHPFLAGVPHSRRPIRPLLQPSYANLFNEQTLQTACIALRLDDSPPQKASTAETPQVDARVPQLTAAQLTSAQWKPYPITPPAALIAQNGPRGAKDAALATNHVPMNESFAQGPWKKAMHEFTQRYPKRFGEIWIYLGPVYSSGTAKLPSGIPTPDALYAIALDLTEAGGLRALALLIPTDAESRQLNDYRTSISQIEQLTGLQFLPELDFSSRDTLGNAISPSVW